MSMGCRALGCYMNIYAASDVMSQLRHLGLSVGTRVTALRYATADLPAFECTVTPFRASDLGARSIGRVRKIQEAASIAAFMYCLLIHSLYF
jgi:hypothetical protein